MKVLESFDNTAGLFRLVLEPQAEGVYIFVFETEASTFPERDYLENTLIDAFELCDEDFGVPRGSWRAVETS